MSFVSKMPPFLAHLRRTYHLVPFSRSSPHRHIPAARTLASSFARHLQITPTPPERTNESRNVLFPPALHLLRTRLTDLYTTVSNSPYGRLMRLDKPIGTNLLFLPAAWSILQTGTPYQTAYLLPLFYGGAVLMRGAGCTINDIWDAEIDAKVHRTKTRPIPAREISVTTAFTMFGVQSLSGLLILTQLNPTTFITGVMSVIPLMFYPFAKRTFSHPQVVLATVFNWGAIMGCTATIQTVTPDVVLLYGAAFCWTIIYDTIYAHQDRLDDHRVGVSSTALSFGASSKPTLAAFLAAKLAFLTTAGLTAGMSLPYFMGISAGISHLAMLLRDVNLNDPASCRAAFENSHITGVITSLSIIAGRII